MSNNVQIKFNGSPVSESENSMDDVATAMRPNKHKNKNTPKKIKSIFLKSGNEKYVSNLSNIALN